MTKHCCLARLSTFLTLATQSRRLASAEGAPELTVDAPSFHSTVLVQVRTPAARLGGRPLE